MTMKNLYNCDTINTKNTGTKFFEKLGINKKIII